MPAISRRRFIRDTSLGAAAVTAVAVVGGSSVLGLATATSADADPVSSEPFAGNQGSPTAMASRTDVIAHVVDDSSGTISVYYGTRKITFEDRKLTDALLKVVR